MSFGSYMLDVLVISACRLALSLLAFLQSKWLGLAGVCASEARFHPGGDALKHRTTTRIRPPVDGSIAAPATPMQGTGVGLRQVALAAVLVAGVVASPWAEALGLGRLTVQSALGEPLRAEVEVTSITPEEAATLRLRVAPAEAYRAAGMEFNAALASAQVQLVRRADGRQFLRLNSDRAVVEPFVDVIV